MNLLFIEGGSKVMHDTEGNIYLSSNLTRSVLERYNRYCDKLTLLLRRNAQVFSQSEASSTANIFDQTLARIAEVPDIYRPRKNMFSFKIRREIKRIMTAELIKADRVVIRSVGNYYVDTAINICRKLGKIYMIECVELTFEMQWYNSLLGKISAPLAEMLAKKYIARAPYVVYVARKTMMKRYPTSGKTLDCSNVELPVLDDSVLDARLGREIPEGKIIFGTAGFINTEVKGQRYVIHAISELQKRGITGIEYHLAGGGSPDKLLHLAETLGVKLKIHGSLPYSQIFDWYDTLDVYIQPSLTEGLCRSVIEAMSRALPVACSDVGGSPELASSDMLFKAGNVEQIADVMRKMLDTETRRRESIRSFTKAHDYEKEKLYARRDEFFREFMK